MEDLRADSPRAGVLLLWLLSIPGLLVLALASSWFFLQAPAVHAARCYFDAPPGGALVLRAQVARWAGGRSQPLAVPVTLRVTEPDGRSSDHRGRSDAHGLVDFNVPLRQPSPSWLHLQLSQGANATPLLAQGRLAWPTKLGESRRGGWIEGRLDGALGVRVGIVGGVLAVPFESKLRVVIQRGAVAMAHQPFTVELHGARLVGGTSRFSTDDGGRAELRIVAEGHHVDLTVRVGGAHPTVYRAALPVVPGALRTRADGRSLVVESPIPRDIAFVNVIDAQRSYLARSVALRAREGSYVGRLEAPFALEGKWAVTSSELDMQSMAVVGWPLGERAVRSTLERKMWLGLDGLEQGRERVARTRLSWRRWGLVAAAVALLLELALLLAYFRVWRREPSQGAAGAFARPVSRSGSWLAAACVVSGFAALTWWWWSRF